MRRVPYQLLAEITGYPTAAVANSLRKLIALVSEESPELGSSLIAFQEAFHAAGLAGMQEAYIQTFDFRTDSCLYVGHHLFGEDGRRGLFLAELKQKYREYQIFAGHEVPDHLSLVLRYLAALEVGEEASDLVHGCLIPAVARIAAVPAAKNSPYGLALEALLLFLKQEDRDNHYSGELAWRSSSSSFFPILR